MSNEPRKPDEEPRQGVDANQGLDADKNPKAEQTAKGGPGEQQQEWPGHESEMRPEADHGEDSYRGADKLSGMRALVTGGDSGIGRAVSIAFAREGADVSIAYYDEEDDAEETAHRCRPSLPWKPDIRRRSPGGHTGIPRRCDRLLTVATRFRHDTPLRNRPHWCFLCAGVSH